MTSDMPRTEAAFSKVIAWAEAHPDASWEESAQNVLTTLSQELADMERELANCKRDLAIMVGMADNEERATERAERAETKLAALQVKPDVAGLVDAYDAARYRFEEWDGDVLIPEQNADLEWRVTEKNAARQRIIDALLSFSAQLAEANRLRHSYADNLDCERQKVSDLEAQLAEKEAECEGLRQDAERYRWVRSPENAWPSVELPGGNGFQGLSDEKADAAIDSAREGKP